ncbi:MAG TPA: 50S ribosomal protein L20 [Turneriella sp.]|nr:50S ribosomal protein L20 [Turneriella sp.]HMY10537.1 50S ribosomal protein L20 [Turneriella sp.]HNA79971.1 50S ribosomal protein L20 [Turneriella sp.]HNE19199.1 50S ribosomal protein L20 [Turneriella sp.]HNL11068.1 50S ribosomal protein L20 [Turneriella sp.]
MRSTNGTIHKNRRKKILKRTKGFRAGRRRLYRTAKDAALKADMWAFRDRKQRKRHFRALWISRINAACREEGISYSKFIAGVLKAKVGLNRKSLSELALNDPAAFKEVVRVAKAA